MHTLSKLHRVAEINTVSEEIIPIASLRNHMDIENVSLCLLLAYLDITDIAKYVKYHFCNDKYWHFEGLSNL